jgi:hypothetical protein
MAGKRSPTSEFHRQAPSAACFALRGVRCRRYGVSPARTEIVLEIVVGPPRSGRDQRVDHGGPVTQTKTTNALNQSSVDTFDPALAVPVKTPTRAGR